MAITIQPFTEAHVEAVKAFNDRLVRGGGQVRFPPSPVPSAFPRRAAVPLHQEYYVALEGETVRGAYIDKSQVFALKGELVKISQFQLSVSEGAVDPRYGMVAVRLLMDALARQPLQFGHGMERYDLPITRFLQTMKWRLFPCPLYGRVVHPYRFLRRNGYLRRCLFGRLALDALAFTGLGWLGIQTVQAVQRLRHGKSAGWECGIVSQFTDWADALWERAKVAYDLIAVRNSTILNTLYPPANEQFLRLQVSRHGEVVGWAVLLDTQMDGHRLFGTIRLGSVVDCLALPGTELDVVTAATQYLMGRGVDVILTNQLARVWCDAFVRNGYLRGPLNCIFAVSPALAARLEPLEDNVRRIHMTVGDGDGPFQATTPRVPAAAP